MDEQAGRQRETSRRGREGGEDGAGEGAYRKGQSPREQGPQPLPGAQNGGFVGAIIVVVIIVFGADTVCAALMFCCCSCCCSISSGGGRSVLITLLFERRLLFPPVLRLLFLALAMSYPSCGQPLLLPMVDVLAPSESISRVLHCGGERATLLKKKSVAEREPCKSAKYENLGRKGVKLASAGMNRIPHNCDHRPPGTPSRLVLMKTRFPRFQSTWLLHGPESLLLGVVLTQSRSFGPPVVARTYLRVLHT